MIKAFCTTTTNGYATETWPQIFGALPRLGDQVESRSGAKLFITAIVHSSIVKNHEEIPQITMELGLVDDVPIDQVQVIPSE